MKTLIEKAEVLIEALPYIQRFCGETVVVKFGGSSLDHADVVARILQDVAFMACVGMRPVVVHGGGKAINASLKARGIPPKFAGGLRVTDGETMRVVEHILNNEVNPDLVARLNALGCKARAIHGEDIITARKLVGEGADGEAMDWGFVGEIVQVDVEPVRAFLDAGITPLVTPLAFDEAKRTLYNINADLAAAGLATELRARKLVFLSDVPGLLADPNDKASLMSTLRLDEVRNLIARGTIGGGMLPKIGGALKALGAGVRKTHIIDASFPHSLLLELFTDKGVGTEIVREVAHGAAPVRRVRDE